MIDFLGKEKGFSLLFFKQKGWKVFVEFLVLIKLGETDTNNVFSWDITKYLEEE